MDSGYRHLTPGYVDMLVPRRTETSFLVRIMLRLRRLSQRVERTALAEAAVMEQAAFLAGSSMGRCHIPAPILGFLR